MNYYLPSWECASLMLEDGGALGLQCIFQQFGNNLPHLEKAVIDRDM